jgi:DNA processing protein
MIAVVGARACTGYGAYIAGTIGADLAAAQIPVVSGAALGIDAAAHRGALAVGGPTVAVLACGIDRVYPRGHEVLLRAIAERGAVLSELPPGASPTRFRFLHRNRIIAALGAGTIVVEAARRSGSLVTARLTAELGRVVMAVPGPVTSEQSMGTHELIRDGATLVTGAAQAREACASLTEASFIAREAARAEAATSGARSKQRRTAAEPAIPAATEPADPIEELVIEALPGARGVTGADVLTLARATGLRPDTVFAALGRLAAAGRAMRAGGGWMLAPSE